MNNGGGVLRTQYKENDWLDFRLRSLTFAVEGGYHHSSSFIIHFKKIIYF